MKRGPAAVSPAKTLVSRAPLASRKMRAAKADGNP